MDQIKGLEFIYELSPKVQARFYLSLESMVLFITKHGQEPPIFTGKGHLTGLTNQLQILSGVCQETHLLSNNCFKKITFNYVMMWTFLIH